jgi:hypothetical protein
MSVLLSQQIHRAVVEHFLQKSPKRFALVILKPGQHSPQFDENILDEFFRVIIPKTHWQFSGPRSHGRDKNCYKLRPCGSIMVL